MSTSTGASRDRAFFGHPRGLANLFGIEIWERFSFYGMQGILAIYLYFQVSEGGLAMPQGTATGIVGAYGGFVYLSTIIGAWVADRLLGRERTLFYSAVMIMIGHICLALIPDFLGVGIGLVCVAVGSGGLKANATALVGSLYREGDERRDGGFSIFYLGVNLGGFVGPLLTGLAQQELGFHYGFGLAAVGMAIGLIQYSIGRKNLGENAGVVSNPLPASLRGRVLGLALAGVVLIVMLTLLGVINSHNLVIVTVIVIVAATIGYFAVILRNDKITHLERRRVVSFIPMYIASAAFFSLFQQQFTVIEVYADKRLNRNLFGWDMPIPWVTSINPIFIILFAGVFAALWTKLGSRQPSTPTKFAAANVAVGVAFLLFLPMAGNTGATTPLLMLVLITFLFTIGELMLSPVGLSLSTKLAPELFPTQMVALNYMSLALGTALSGWFANFYDVDNEGQYFGVLGGASIVLGIAIAIATPYIRKLMSGVH